MARKSLNQRFRPRPGRRILPVIKKLFGLMDKLISPLIKAVKLFHCRGWSLGTSGNFSVVLTRSPFELAITPSQVDKGELTAADMVRINAEGKKTEAHPENPSEERLIHITIAKEAKAEVVFHIHSVSSTLLSNFYAAQKGVLIQGYEMLKGLEGVAGPESREWVPILENHQDMRQLSGEIKSLIVEYPNIHAILLHNHGVYTWGKTIHQAKRHLEVLEFLFQVLVQNHERRM